MSLYLISFPPEAMEFPPEEFAQVVEESHQVIRDAKAAGVYVFAGGIDESIAPVRVSADGAVRPGPYASTTGIRGGFTVLRLPSISVAHEWAARIAAACRCAQEVRVFGDDAEI
jgi:hypothetical protein